MAVITSNKKTKKVFRFKEAQFAELDRAVYNFICSRIRYMGGESLFREDIIQSKGFEVLNEMKTAIKMKLESDLPDKRKVTLQEKLQSLSKITASRG